MMEIVHLLCEYRSNPLGIDVTAPRFSWQMQTTQAGARQTAYRILAASDPKRLSEGKADVWDSGRIESDQSILIPYAGQPVSSRQRVYWSVRVWDETASALQGESAWFELGLLANEDWKGDWIGANLRGGPHSSIPAPYLRQTFSLLSHVN